MSEELMKVAADTTLNWSTNTDERIGFWQQYTYEHARGNYSIIHRCSICGFHPCDPNLGQYKFCPSCGTSMIATPKPPIVIKVSTKPEDDKYKYEN